MAEYLDQFSKGLADLLPYEWIMIRHLERGIGRETTFARLGRAAKHHHSYRLIHACPSRRCSRNDVSYRTDEPFPVVPQGAEIEFVFATEAGIDARLFDTQPLRQHIHGSATVPVIPKHGQRAIQSDSLLNFSRHECTRHTLTSDRHRQTFRMRSSSSVQNRWTLIPVLDPLCAAYANDSRCSIDHRPTSKKGTAWQV